MNPLVLYLDRDARWWLRRRWSWRLEWDRPTGHVTEVGGRFRTIGEARTAGQEAARGLYAALCPDEVPAP